MLIGRRGERERLARLLNAVRSGRPDGLLVVGEPGIGKTALLDWLRDSAGDLTTISARGTEGEERLAFAALGDLLGPVLGHLGELPGPQEAALRAALGLGPPVVPDRFAAYAATLGLITAAARRGPLLIVVDDVHWIDTPSAEALGFCARRLGDDPVGLVIATRADEPVRVDVARLEEVRLRGLADAEAEDVLRAATPGRLAPEIARRLTAAARGNPLALWELPALLDPDQLAGTAPLPEPLRPGEAVTRAFGRRIQALPEPARRAAVLAACSRDGALAVIGRALREWGRTPADLEPAEAARLVEISAERARFRHPLLRAVTLELASPAARREAHRALARALDPDDVEPRGWHLALAAAGPDEAVASALEAAAERAAARTGYAAAAAAMERAASLSPDAAGAARRRVAAAQNAHAAGRPEWALRLLERAGEGVGDPVERAGIAHLRGLLTMLAGNVDDAFHLLTGEAARVDGHDVVRAASMFADAVPSRGMAGLPRAAVATAQRAAMLVPADPPATVLLNMGCALAADGRSDEARAWFARAAPAMATIDPLSPAALVVAVSFTPRIWLEDYAGVDAALAAWIAGARALGAPSALGWPLAVACELGQWLGRWAPALADGQEAVRLLRETDQPAPLSYALATLARLEAALGRGAEAAAHAEAAVALSSARGTASVTTYARAALGLLALGERRLDDAVAHLAPLVDTVEEAGLRQPAAVPWQPDLVAALVGLGRVAEARRALGALAEQAGRTRSTWARAVTARGRGLIDPDFDRHFREALALHALTPTPFERARTELRYGERLREARRRPEARAHLESALRAFERLGAAPWASQARDGLAALGLRRRPPARPPDRLSPRELQVALAVAEGASNAQVASRLFISEKTVERHLGSAYRKLGLRSRTELAWRLARERGRAAPEPRP
jgi:DNA-binding CsgD family transcriptional regulator